MLDILVDGIGNGEIENIPKLNNLISSLYLIKGSAMLRKRKIGSNGKFLMRLMPK